MVAQAQVSRESAQCEVRASVQRPDRLRVEARDLAKQMQEPRPKQIAPLAENCVEVPRPPFQPSVAGGQREAHVALVGSDAEMAEQRRQVWVVPLVVDDEARIDRDRAIAVPD